MDRGTSLQAKSLYIAALCAAVWLCLVYVGSVYRQKSEGTKVVMCDVGQGDGMYIRTTKGTDVVVDVGSGEEILHCLGKHMPLFDKHIEMLIISHPHYDHYGGLHSLLRHYSIGSLLAVPVAPGSDSYPEIFRSQSIQKTYVPLADTSIAIDTSALLHIFWPTQDFILEHSSKTDSTLRSTTYDLNSFSIVASFESEGVRILLTGDAPTDFLLRAVPHQTFNILKVSHHGSSTGTNKELLRHIHPDLGLISAGKSNRYGHPSRTVTEALRHASIPYLLTARDGEIVLRLHAGKWATEN